MAARADRDRTVRSVGFFAELSPGWGLPTDGPIGDAVRPVGEPDEDGIVAYLMNGTGLWSEMSATTDVLDPEGPTLAGAGSLRTDGTWVWRDDLSYYVHRHHVVLPAPFLARVRMLDHTPPRVPDSRLADILTRDLGIPLD
ncbi:hypothetical protein [Streptomyces fumanus]|uniref:Uncharacterized protein n=1 Tax=Streptomyces fumanus TaxID=67302 RepID=A0A919AUY7_9ACTN|nr:hypothetical protein [Streptomyces fumanus]GHF26848.1 hypothetical protein GCM10018772_60730 [Streptomyces fumanus]